MSIIADFLVLVGLLLLPSQCDANSRSVTDAACGLNERESTEALGLIQRHAGAAEQQQPGSKAQMQRLNATKPIYWLHVPKCGTTFINALLQHPGLCPKASSTDYMTADALYASNFTHFQQSVDLKCPGSFIDTHYFGLHRGIGPRYKDLSLKGHMVTLMREPKSRLISAYNYAVHSWPYKDKEGVTLTDYAALARGHFLKMLIRDYDGDWSVKDRVKFFADPTEHEITQAHKRLREGFAYVGITEEWKLSMCLFHKMFGGQCVAAEFIKVNPNPKEDALLHKQEEELKSFKDPFDGPLYKMALERFHADLKKYNVSEESCQPCFQHAEAMDLAHTAFID